MYMVVSRWEPLPGKTDEFALKGKAMRGLLMTLPGVTLVEGFVAEDGAAVAVVGYESREAYDRIVNDPNGPFVKAATENNLEELATWVRSERGETIPH